MEVTGRKVFHDVHFLSSLLSSLLSLLLFSAFLCKQRVLLLLHHLLVKTGCRGPQALVHISLLLRGERWQVWQVV